MAFCTNCGHDFGNEAFCTNCGQRAEDSQKLQPKTSPGSVGTVLPTLSTLRDSSNSLQEKSVSKKSNKNVILGVAAAIVVLLFIVGAATAKRWEKIDVPAHAETFHTETYQTGNYDIVDTGVNPCWVGEDWTDCANSHVETYNSTCAAVPLSSQGSSYCSRYSAMIDDMQARDRYGYWVSSLGSWGYLTAVPEEATEQVSNNDYRAAETHEAVCYFGFLGECQK